MPTSSLDGSRMISPSNFIKSSLPLLYFSYFNFMIMMFVSDRFKDRTGMLLAFRCGALELFVLFFEIFEEVEGVLL